MSELVITAVNFNLQPMVDLRDGPAVLRWAYNRSFLASDGTQVQWGTQTTGFGIEVPCSIADGLITVDQDSTLWTTDDAQDTAPLSILISAWLLTARGKLIQQLTIASEAQWVVPVSLAPTTSWAEFSNYNQANSLWYANPTYYNAPQTDAQIRNFAATNYASDTHLGGVYTSIEPPQADQPVVWAVGDPLVRDAIKLQGVDIADTPPSDGQFLIFNQTNNDWEPANAGFGTGNVISNEVSSVDGELTLFSGTGGKTIKRGNQTGLLRGTSGVVSASTVGTSDVDDAAITYAKMQDISAASRLIGRGSAAGAGSPEEITLGGGLSMSGTTLSASGLGGDIRADGTVPFAADESMGGFSLTDLASPDALTDAANKDFVLQSVAAAVQQTPNISALVTGGGVFWTDNYNFTVSAATYLIQGDLFSSLQTDVTLDAADPTLDRIDVIAVNDTGVVVVITGVAASQPSSPDVDPGTQLQLTFVLVTANTTEPVTVSNEDIYLENTEWTATTSGSGWNVNSTNNPLPPSSKCIEGTNVANLAYVQLQAPAPLTLDTFSLLSLFIASKAAWPKKRSLVLQWFSAGVAKGTPLTVNTGFFGFDSSNTAYQLLAIPLAQFAIPAGTSLNQLRITDTGGAIGMFIDNVVLQANGTSIGPPAQSGITQDQADARYLQRANNLSDVVTPNTALNTLLPTQTGNNGKVLGTNGSDTSWVTGTGSTVPTTAQGDTLYASAANTLATLTKDTNATRYLANTGASNNPAWAQVDLTNGVTGDLPLSNLAQASAASRLLGRGSAGGAGDFEEITLGSGLSMSTTTLTASGGTIVGAALGLVLAVSSANYSN